jgi:hypothetical protein
VTPVEALLLGWALFVVVCLWLVWLVVGRGR